MAQLPGTPSGYLTMREVAGRLGKKSVRSLYYANILSLLDWYEVGDTHLYTIDSVNTLALWLLYRQSRIAFGEISEKAPLSPPRREIDKAKDLDDEEDAKSRRLFLEGWADEGHLMIECPECKGIAFEEGTLGEGRIWCSNCKNLSG